MPPSDSSATVPASAYACCVRAERAFTRPPSSHVTTAIGGTASISKSVSAGDVYTSMAVPSTPTSAYRAAVPSGSPTTRLITVTSSHRRPVRAPTF